MPLHGLTEYGELRVKAGGRRQMAHRHATTQVPKIKVLVFFENLKLQITASDRKAVYIIQTL